MTQTQHIRRLGVLTAFPPGRNSLNEFGFHLVNHLAANDDVESVVVFADATDAGDPIELEANSGKVENVVCWSFNSLTNPIKIMRAVRKAKIDALIVNLQFATFGDSKIAGGLGLLTPALVKKMGVPTAVVLHNLVDNVDMQDAGFTDSKAMAWCMNKAGRALTRVILRTDYVALTIPRYVEFLIESYGADNALLAPHGSFEEIAEPSFGVPADGPRRILAFGKWGTYKTVDILVEAVRDLGARGYDDLELVIAGTDSPNAAGYLQGVADSCTDMDNVVFTGYVAEEDVEPLFSGSAVTAFPYTSTTGSSGVLHQAGSYGRSAVLPAIGDFVEVIEEEGFVGVYFEPGSATGLADAIAQLLDDDELNAEHGRRNYLAATGIPMAEVIDWHLIHLNRVTTDGA
jgi:glycosyltransferase involved in cell wall biosynthesis